MSFLARHRHQDHLGPRLLVAFAHARERARIGARRDRAFERLFDDRQLLSSGSTGTPSFEHLSSGLLSLSGVASALHSTALPDLLDVCDAGELVFDGSLIAGDFGDVIGSLAAIDSSLTRSPFSSSFSTILLADISPSAIRVGGVAGVDRVDCTVDFRCANWWLSTSSAQQF